MLNIFKSKYLCSAFELQYHKWYCWGEISNNSFFAPKMIDFLHDYLPKLILVRDHLLDHAESLCGTLDNLFRTSQIVFDTTSICLQEKKITKLWLRCTKIFCTKQAYTQHTLFFWYIRLLCMIYSRNVERYQKRGKQIQHTVHFNRRNCKTIPPRTLNVFYILVIHNDNTQVSFVLIALCQPGGAAINFSKSHRNQNQTTLLF